jgi:hypothetical protein
MAPAIVLVATIAAAAVPAHSQTAADSNAAAVSPSPLDDQPLPPLPGEDMGGAPATRAAAARPRRVAADLFVPLGFPPDTLNVKLARALERAGVDRAWLAPDAHALALWGGGAGRVPLFDALAAAPERAPDMLRVLGAGAVAATGSTAELVLFAGQRAGFGVRRGLVGSPHAGRWAATGDALAFERAVVAIAESSAAPAGAAGAPAPAQPAVKKSSKKKDARPEIQAVGDVPPDALHLGAFLLGAMRDALAWRSEALAALALGGAGDGTGNAGAGPPGGSRAPDAALDAAFAHLVRTLASTDTASPPGAARDAAALLSRVDLALLHAGAMDLALALDEARARARNDSLGLAGDYHLEAETPLGTVVLDGTHAARYDDPGPYLLIVDAGGHDTYAGGAATLSARSPISVIFDLGGDDVYAAAAAGADAAGAGAGGVGPARSDEPPRPSWGGACLGYAMLVDVAGNDTYRGATLALGAAIAGAGVLHDLAGDDRYDAIAFAQGAAWYGAGVLGDAAGRDRYRAYQSAQGFGGPRGAGVLADSSGDDEYRADDSDIRFPSAQSPRHNASLAQGMGCGLRADFDDGHSLAGGVGFLADGAGDDAYHCGVFGQGAGYWHGLGALYDAAGDDSFDGVWYVQGAAAHFAFGALLEMDGDDGYRATDNMAQGAGHDVSVGMLLDFAGDDRREAPNLSLGGGNANGVGLFFDAEGRDYYRAAGAITFGRGDNRDARGTLRDLYPTVGVFLDGGERDDYPPDNAMVRNGASWRQEGTSVPSLSTEIGVGDDRQ